MKGGRQNNRPAPTTKIGQLRNPSNILSPPARMSRLPARASRPSRIMVTPNNRDVFFCILSSKIKMIIPYCSGKWIMFPTNSLPPGKWNAFHFVMIPMKRETMNTDHARMSSVCPIRRVNQSPAVPRCFRRKGAMMETATRRGSSGQRIAQ